MHFNFIPSLKEIHTDHELYAHKFSFENQKISLTSQILIPVLQNVIKPGKIFPHYQVTANIGIPLLLILPRKTTYSQLWQILFPFIKNSFNFSSTLENLTPFIQLKIANAEGYIETEIEENESDSYPTIILKEYHYLILEWDLKAYHKYFDEKLAYV